MVVVVVGCHGISCRRELAVIGYARTDGFGVRESINNGFISPPGASDV